MTQLAALLGLILKGLFSMLLSLSIPLFFTMDPCSSKSPFSWLTM